MSSMKCLTPLDVKFLWAQCVKAYQQAYTSVTGICRAAEDRMVAAFSKQNFYFSPK